MITTTCRVCGVVFRQGNHGKRTFCDDDSCIQTVVYERLDALVRPEGDHLIWTGRISRTDKMHRIDVTAGTKRTNVRVIDLIIRRRGGDPQPMARWQRWCDEDLCVEPDHHDLMSAKSLVIEAQLPLEPLMSKLYECKVADRLYHRIQKAKEQGYFTVTQADEICIDHLKVHPCQVYGDLFFTAGIEEAA